MKIILSLHLKDIPVFLIGRKYRTEFLNIEHTMACYWVYFDNGYTASIARFHVDYVFEEKGWVLAVLDKNGDLACTTPVTSSIKRGDEARMEELLIQIGNLPEVP